MPLPTRVNTRHATLAFVELAAVPVSILATFFVLLLAAGAVAVTRATGEALAIRGSVIEFVVGALIVLTAVTLLAAGGLAVIGYRSYVDRYFSPSRSTPLLAAPLIGVVVPLGYAAVSLEMVPLPWWLFLVVAISAYALAFRAIALDSIVNHRPRVGVLLGILTGVPAIVALVDLVTNRLLDEGWNGVALTLLGVVDGPGVPQERAVIVAVPLLVAGLLGLQRVTADDGRWSVPRSWTKRAKTSTRDVKAPLGPITGRLGDRVKPTRLVAASIRTASASLWRRTAGTLGSSSSTSAGGKLKGKLPRRVQRGTSRTANPPPPPSSPVAPSSPSGGSRKRRSSGSGSSTSGSKSKAASTSSSRADGSGSKRASSSATSGPSAGKQASGGGSSSSSKPAPSDDDGGSETRIFVDDFSPYGADGSPVETCPACNEDIPSDGVYTFCPFCGHEL